MCVASQQTLILQEVYCGWDGDDSGVISVELISSLPTSCLARTTTLVSTQHIYDRTEQQPRVHIVRWHSKNSRTSRYANRATIGCSQEPKNRAAAALSADQFYRGNQA